MSSARIPTLPDPTTAEAIRYRKSQYCRFTDTADWAALEQLILPTATFEFYDATGSVIQTADGGAWSFSSRQEFMDFNIQRWEGNQTVHVVGPGELEQVAPDEVAATWAAVTHMGPTEGVEGHMVGGTYYRETWKSVKGVWLLGRMTARLVYRRG
ncbi:hypothetical protein BJY00DRAFT_315613 [Aspergillus carlsbadensis]|nr:hypothetical protein BJY00DRAFT_315613 [Aspergillus carlsbadensis]